MIQLKHDQLIDFLLRSELGFLGTIRMTILSLLVEIMQLTLLPILLFQGAKIRESALKLPEAQGPRAGESGVGRRLKIIFLGDSSACGVGVDRMEDSLSGHLIKELMKVNRCSWKVLAKSGISIDGLRACIDQEPQTHFEIAILAVGMNDVTSGKSLSRWTADLELIQESLRENFQISKIIFSGIPPVRKLEIIPFPLRIVLALKAYIFDLSLQQFCYARRSCEYVSIDFSVCSGMLSKDGFHPSKKFYKTWAAKLSRKIRDFKYFSGN